MHPLMVQELARQRHAEQVAKASAPRPTSPHKHQRHSLRSHTGWALVSIGLRIAAADNRHPSVAAATNCH